MFKFLKNLGKYFGIIILLIVFFYLSIGGVYLIISFITWDFNTATINGFYLIDLSFWRVFLLFDISITSLYCFNRRK